MKAFKIPVFFTFPGEALVLADTLQEAVEKLEGNDAALHQPEMVFQVGGIIYRVKFPEYPTFEVDNDLLQNDYGETAD